MKETNPEISEGIKLSKIIPAYIDGVTRFIIFSEADIRWAAEIFYSYRTQTQFENEFVICSGENVVLLADSDGSPFADHSRSFLYFWNNNLWPIYTLTLWCKNGRSFRAFFKYDSSEFDLFRKRSTQIILLTQGKLVSAIEVDFPNVNSEVWNLLDERVPDTFLREEIGGKSYVDSQLRKPRNNNLKLEFAWAKRLNAEVYDVIDYYGKYWPLERFQDERKYILNSLYGEIFKNDILPISKLYTYFYKCLKENKLNPVEHYKILQSGLSLDAPNHSIFIMTL